MNELENSARRLLDILRTGHPEDVYKQEAATMIFAEGFKLGTIAGERRAERQQQEATA